MRIVTFYTPQYAGELDGWKESLSGLPWKYWWAELSCRGSWRANVGMKPDFLLEALQVFQERILFIDIDGRVRGQLPLFQSVQSGGWFARCDFAAYFIPHDEMTAGHRPGGQKTTNDGIASGTMYFNYTPAAIDFLELWREREKKREHRYGQIVLGETWHFDRPAELVTARLPQRYCKVFDARWKKNETGPVEIEHLQASRRLRRKVG